MTTIVAASAPVQRVLERLASVKRGASGWVARCPAHEDNNPSLTISEGRDGRAVLHCHAGCEPSSVVAAIGMTMPELFPPKTTNGGSITPLRRTVELYDYTDENGALRFQVVRTSPKGFYQRRPHPARPGEWISGLGDVQPTLYRLPELIEAIATGKPICIVEGEKDVDELRARGREATTNPMGAGKWRDAFAPYFDGADVVLLPDNDDAGRRHMDDVERSLTGVARRIVRVALPGLPPKGDVSDWLAGGHTPKELDALIVRATPAECRQVRFTLGELKQRPELLLPPEYVIPRLVARSRSTLIYAREKDGKSTFVAFVIAVKSRGGALFGKPCTAGVVLLIALEEFVGDVVRRLVAFGGHDDRLHIVTELQGTTIEERIAEVRRHVVETGAHTVVVDTLIALVAGRVESTNSDGDMQPVIQGLSDIAHQTGCGMLIVAHANKTGDARGSGVIKGGVDIAAEMTIPDRQEDPNLRALHVRGRIPVEHFRVRYTGNGFDLAEDGLADTEARVLDVVTVHPGSSTTYIRSAVGGKASLVDAAIVRLIERRQLVDEGSENRHAYHRADTLSRVGTGGTGPDSAMDAPPSPRPCPTGTGPGQGSDNHGDSLSENVGQASATPREPLKGSSGRALAPGHGETQVAIAFSPNGGRPS